MKRTPAKPTRQHAKPLQGSAPEREPLGAAKKRVAGPEPAGSQTDPAVIALLRELDHPLKPEIEAVR